MTRHEVPKSIDMRVKAKGIDYRLFYLSILLCASAGFLCWMLTGAVLIGMGGGIAASTVVFPLALYLSAHDPLLPVHFFLAMFFDPGYLDPAE